MTKRKEIDKSAPLSPQTEEGKKPRIDSYLKQPSTQHFSFSDQSTSSENAETSSIESLPDSHNIDIAPSIASNSKIIPLSSYEKALTYLRDQKILSTTKKAIKAEFIQLLGGSLEVSYSDHTQIKQVKETLIPDIFAYKKFKSLSKFTEFLLELGAVTNYRKQWHNHQYLLTTHEYIIYLSSKTRNQSQRNKLLKIALLLIKDDNTMIDNTMPLGIAALILGLNFNETLQENLIDTLLNKDNHLFSRRDKKGNTLFHLLFSSKILMANRNEILKLKNIELYLTHKIDLPHEQTQIPLINLPNDEGQTPLHLIANYNYLGTKIQNKSFFIEICQRIMDQGVFPALLKVDKYGKTVFHMAIQSTASQLYRMNFSLFSLSEDKEISFLSDMLKHYFKDEKNKSGFQSFIDNLIETDFPILYKFSLLEAMGITAFSKNPLFELPEMRSLLQLTQVFSVDNPPTSIQHIKKDKPEIETNIASLYLDNQSKLFSSPYAFSKLLQGKPWSQILTEQLNRELLGLNKTKYFSSYYEMNTLQQRCSVNLYFILKAQTQLEQHQLHHMVELTPALKEKLAASLSETIEKQNPDKINLPKDIFFYLLSFLDFDNLKTIALTIKECGYLMRSFMANINGKKLYALSETEGERLNLLCLDDTEKETRNDKNALRLIPNPFAQKSGESYWQDIVNLQKKKSADSQKWK